MDLMGRIVALNVKLCYWAVVSCGAVIMLYKVFLAFESVDEIL